MPTPVVEKNKAVFFTYSITDENGVIVERSDLSIGYIHGIEGNIIEKLEMGMAGKKTGDKLEIMLAPEEGFGETDPGLIFTDNLENIPSQYHKLGATVEMENDDGDVKAFTVTKITENELTLDGNHPLAGKDITFNITITEIRDASAEELLAGEPVDITPPVLH